MAADPDHRFWGKCVVGILLLGIVRTASSTDEGVCRANSKCHDSSLIPGRMSSNATSDDGDYERSGAYYEMNFCVEGYTSLTWSKMNLSSGERAVFRPFPMGSRGVLCRQNQSLAFPKLESNDSGWYQAIASNGTHELMHVIFLSVSADGKPTERVNAYEHPPSQVKARIGDNVTLNCSGYFGGGDPNLQNLEWLYYKNSSLEFIPANSHIYVENLPEQQHKRMSRLHVVGVRLEDFDITFQCRMSSAIVGNQYCFNVTLVQPETRDFTSTIIAICVGSAFFVIVIILLLALLYQKQYISYQWRLHWRRPKSGGNLAYDIFLFSDDEHMEFARGSLLPRLEAMGFRVCEYHRNAPVNRQEMEVQEELLRQCACTLLVHSSSDVDPQNNQNNHNTDILVSMVIKKAHPMVTVLLESPQDIRDSLRKHPSDEQQNARKVLKFFPYVEWPREGDSGHVQKFWDKLQRRLPKPAATTEHPRHSSSQPLISPAEEEAGRYLTDCDEADFPPVFAEEGGVTGVAVPGRRGALALKQQLSKDSGFASPPSCDTAPIADLGPPRWPQVV